MGKFKIKTFAKSQEVQNPLVEAIYKINIGFDLSEDEAFDAFKYALEIKDPLERSTFLGVILNGTMSKKPLLEEVRGFLRATFVLDGLDPQKTKRVNITGHNVIGLAGSWKKGIKTTNISSCAAIVAAAGGAYVMKSCSSATSSLVGSSDFIELIGGNIKITSEEMLEVLKKTGLGFFSIENRIKKFDSLYGGKFHAPHVLSFALAGLSLPFKPDVMFYGLSHPNIVLSAKVFNSFGYDNVFVVSSTDNGLHFLDEVCVFGTTYIVGYKEGKLGSLKLIQPGDALNLPRYNRNLISSGKNISENIHLSLAVLNGLGDSAREDLVCVNSATILFLSKKVETLEEGFLLSKKIIRNGLAIAKLKEFIEATGGSLKKLDENIFS